MKSDEIQIQEQIKVIRKNQEGTKELKVETDQIEKPLTTIDLLPLLPVDGTSLTSKKPESTIKRKGKEINMNDFNLLDYPVIRKNSKIEIEKSNMSGTSANKETVAQSNYQDDVWDKEYYIPSRLS